VRRPSAGLYFSEPIRGLAGLGKMPLAAPWLASAPRGDHHGVLVLPGLLASDASTAVLRRFLRRLGYQVQGWNLGRNLGPTEQVLDRLPRELSALAGRSAGPVSVIGWSMGGIYARELARRHPGQVRQVLTLASPFALTGGRRGDPDGAPTGAPSTAVYSRRDGIVAWQACIGPETARHENVEVRCAHLGFGTDPATLWLIADRLAAAAGQRRPFSPPPALRSLYPGR
jgi:pimeloyl-ACP methyl ester carboxylesterase